MKMNSHARKIVNMPFLKKKKIKYAKINYKYELIRL